MQTVCSDIQTVAESSAALFEMIHQSSISPLVTLSNLGANTINYRFQEYIDAVWTDIGVSGDDSYNTLTAGQTRTIKLAATSAKVRLYGNASGGSTLWFTVDRFLTRASGGALPLLTY